jgi:membrane protease YdiL (CAAX protease family)
LFRGILQNLLSRRAKKAWVALLAASLVFGLAHLNNATSGHAVPNWAYVAMATLAGLAYGWVWRRTKKVTASAITHMLVNLVWGILIL